MSARPIYLDYQATTPVDPRVMTAMQPFFVDEFGNAASKTHDFGARAARAVEMAREQVAALIGAKASEVVFTSGATESNNLAIKSAVQALADRGDALVTCATEHKSVLDTCRRLERQRAEHRDGLRSLDPGLTDDRLDAWARTYRSGAQLHVLPVGSGGQLDPERLDAALGPETVLASVMLANNEIGVVQPIEELGRRCRAKGVLFHCDAAQGLSTLALDVTRSQVDLVSLSAHKLYGPKGVGALDVRADLGVRLRGLMDGGGHERGLRSGTLNVAGIVGFGAAAELARSERAAEHGRLLALRERLLARVQRDVEGVTVNGTLEHRLAGNLSLARVRAGRAAAEGAARRRDLRGLGVHVGVTRAFARAAAIGVPQDAARGTVRVSLGRFTTEHEVDRAAARIAEEVAKLRAANPAWLAGH